MTDRKKRWFMDLVDALRRKIGVLDDGEYLSGLNAVLMHVETAFRHLMRGQETSDETAYTDAIYRTNQAFEGSLKEAYRVLAGQDPSKHSPYNIENYLEKNKIFRSRTLKLLTNYRVDWRNPSTHDYKLDFDESEAFLAIISVSAFACLLLDQITEKLAFNKSKKELNAQKSMLQAGLAKAVETDFFEYVVSLIELFCKNYAPSTHGMTSEAQISGTLQGFIATAAPSIKIESEIMIGNERQFRSDILVERNGERVVIEIKRRMMKHSYDNAVRQVERYILQHNGLNGVLLFLPETPSEMERRNIITVDHEGAGRIAIISPLGSNYAF
jgi:HEPN domain-containing protein